MFPIPLNANGSIAKKNTYGTAPLPLLNIPAEIERSQVEHVMPDMTVRNVTEFIFYCNSQKKEDVTPESIRNPEINENGCGTLENPWVDFNNALAKVQCLASMVCDSSYAFKIILSGEINYAVGSYGMQHKGYGLVTVDCTNAVWETEVEYDRNDYTYSFRYLCGITFENIGDFLFRWTAGATPNYTMISDCSLCKFSFKSITVDMLQLSGHYCEPQAIVVYNSKSCQIFCESAIINAEYCPWNSYTYHIFAYENSDCFFAVPKLDLTATYSEKTASRTYIEAFGYQNNIGCTFSACNANLTVRNNTSRPDTDFVVTGCGWYGNTDNVWLDENIGYCRYIENGSLQHVTDCTLNENCKVPFDGSITPSSSSSSSDSDAPKGTVYAVKYTRKILFRLFGTTYVETDGCKFDLYAIEIIYNWEIERPDPGRWYPYGKYDTVDGYLEEDWENPEETYCEYWGDIDCSSPEFATGAAKAVTEATADIVKFVNGELYDINKNYDYPISEFGWNGFKNYYRAGSGAWSALTKDGDEISFSTKTSASYYDAWGGNPCGGGDGTGSVELESVVFLWYPENEDETREPKYVKFRTPDGKTIKVPFGEECCLQGVDDVDFEILKLTTCAKNEEGDCPYVILNGTTTNYDITQEGVTLVGSNKDYPQPTMTKHSKFTFKGVKF